jgi:hypothetical protein
MYHFNSRGKWSSLHPIAAAHTAEIKHKNRSNPFTAS